MRPLILISALTIGMLTLSDIRAQTLVKTMSSANGTVQTVVKNSGKYYIGGNFTYVGLLTGSAGALTTSGDVPDLNFPGLNGEVIAAVSDGSNGWYIGGSFTQADGNSVSSLLHILSDKTIDPVFNASITNGSVYALALKGSTLYIGGAFTQVNSTSRNYLASVNKTSGNLQSWNPSPDNNVYTVALGGTTLFVGGAFSQIAGKTHKYLAAFNTSNGSMLNNIASTNSYVQTIRVKGDTIFIGGNFTSLGFENNYIASLTTSSDIPAHDFPVTNGIVRCIIPDGTGGWYVGGGFTQIGGLSRQNLARIKSNKSVDASFVADCSGGDVYSMVLSGSKLYAGGGFTAVNSTARSYLACVNATSGILNSTWNPGCNNAVYTMTKVDTCIYIGGSFSTLGGYPQKYFSRVGLIKGKVVGGLTNTNSYVQKVLAKGDSVFIGGNFTKTGFDNPYLAAITTTTDVPDVDFPRTDGTVYCIIPDGSGGWYVGGNFSTIGGVSRQNLAHVKSNKSIDANPSVTFNGEVRTIVKSGSNLHIGGTFTTVGGNNRQYLAAVNSTNSNVTSWNPSANNAVYTLVLKDTLFYAGGAFTAVGNKARYYLASIGKSGGKTYSGIMDANSYVQKISVMGDSLVLAGNFTSLAYTQPSLAAFTPSLDIPDRNFASTNGEVKTIISDGAGGYFIGGSFTIVDGVSRPYLAKLNASGQLVSNYTPLLNGEVNALYLTGTTLYAGGAFTTSNGASRLYLTALSTTGAGANKTWSTTANNTVLSLEGDGTSLFAGGDFTQVSNVNRNRLAKFNLNGALDSTFNPNADNSVRSLVLSGSNVYAGGYFQNVGGALNRYVVKLSKTTGAVSAWITSDSYVEKLIIDGSNIYLGGQFTQVNGTSRGRCAGVVISSGNLLALNPDFNSTVYSLAVSGSKLFAGGSFTQSGITSRNRLAAFNTGTGALIGSWNPDANSTVKSLLANASVVLAGGNFDKFKSGSRSYGSIIPLPTGEASSWNPLLDYIAYDIAWNNDHFYLAGAFHTANVISHNCLVSFNRNTLAMEAWDPQLKLNGSNTQGTARAVYATNTDIYIGGQFDALGASSRQNFANVSVSNASLKSINPGPDNLVYSIGLNGTKLVLGGQFTFLDGNNKTYCAAIRHSTGKANSFSPSLDYIVYDMAVNSSKLFVVGSFDNAGGQSRPGAAAFNFSGGGLANWNPLLSLNNVPTSADLWSVAANDTEIYLGGNFNRVDVTTRNYIAKVNATTGAVKSWNPQTNAIVYEILQDNNKVLIGGNFVFLKHGARNYLASVSKTTGIVSGWDPSPDYIVYDLAFNSTRLYAAGAFDNVNGIARAGAAAFLLTNLSLDNSWNALLSLNGSPSYADLRAVYADDNNVYLGGNFDHSGTTERKCIAQFNPSTSALKSWDPSANGIIYEIAKSGSNILAGGNFQFMKGAARNYLACIDAGTGLLTSWNPGSDGYVYALAVNGSNLYVGGQFGNLNSVAKKSLGAINMNTGNVASFACDVLLNGSNGIVYDLKFDGSSNLYIGGNFNSVKGSTRNFAASVTSGGSLRNWNPVPGAQIKALLVKGNQVYLGGSYITMNTSVQRNYLSSVDTAAGTVTSFNPYLNGTVEDLESNATTLYATGSFSTVNNGAQSRGYGAAYAFSNNSLQSWNPAAGSTVYGHAVASDTVYLGGSFSTINGISRLYEGAVRTGAGSSNTAFDPQPNSSVLENYISGTQLVVCGNFTKINGKNRQCLAVYNLPAGPLPGADPDDQQISREENVPVQNQIRVYPNPAGEAFFVNIPEKTAVADIFLYSTEGKLIRQWHPFNSSGIMEIPLHGISSGLYHLLVISGGNQQAIRLLVSE